MDSFEIEINNQFQGLIDPEDRTQAVCSILADSKFKLDSGTLSIAFVDNASIKDLHDSFLGDPSSTDVITFPGNPTFESVGDYIRTCFHVMMTSVTYIYITICQQVTSSCDPATIIIDCLKL